MLKTLLKKFLPMSARTAHAELTRLQHTVDEQKALSMKLFLYMQLLEDRLSGGDIARLAEREELINVAGGSIFSLERITPRPLLRFEVDLAGHCNMRCKSCAHFSPLCPEDFADFNEVDRSFARLSALFGGRAEYIHLMGGEPLLHPRVTDFFAGARRHFPYGEIDLVSNGLLLPQQPEGFWLCCRDNDITVCVTKYPINLDYQDIEARAEQYGVKFHYYNCSENTVKSFRRLALSRSGDGNPIVNFLRCGPANTCLYLSKGRLYPCSIISHVHYLNEYFGLELAVTEADSADIFAVSSGRELLKAMARPVPFCAYCSPPSRDQEQPWGMSERALGEWVD